VSAETATATPLPREIVRCAFEAHAEDDDFVQPGNLVRKVLDDAARERLVGNAVARLRNDVTEPVLPRAVGYLCKRRPDPRRPGPEGRPRRLVLTGRRAAMGLGTNLTQYRLATQEPAEGFRKMDNSNTTAYFEIRVRGQMGEMLLGAFPGLRAEIQGTETVLAGVLPDGAALYSVLAEIEALGLELLEVRRPHGWGAARRETCLR
jgi:hypothetical protein